MIDFLSHSSWAGVGAMITALGIFIAYLSGRNNNKSSEKLSKRLPNIFEELSPGSSIEKMKALLGIPHAQGDSYSGINRVVRGFVEATGEEYNEIKGSQKQYSFRFNDAYVQIRSNDDETINELMVLSRGSKRIGIFEVHRTDVKIGKTTLESTLQDKEEIQKDYSAKHHLEYTYSYLGAPGNYLHYYFGSLETMNNPSPKDSSLINFSAVTETNVETPYFDWAHLQ